MKLAERWLEFIKPYMDRLLMYARKDTNVSLAEYNELKTKYKELFK